MSEFTSIDNLETLMLMAMDSQHYIDSGFKKSKKEPSGYSRQVVDSGSLSGQPSRFPTESYTFDPSGERIYTPDIKLLLNNPLQTIGDGMETILFFEQKMKWCRFEPIQKPKKFNSVGKVEQWMCAHYREINVYGDQYYTKEVFPVHKSGKVMPLAVEGWNFNGGSAQNMEGQMALCCSMVEDSQRPGVLLAKASFESSIVFPIKNGAHKEFFALRDAPKDTPTGRRNPILHFCSSHLRSNGGDTISVKSHWRGRDKITIAGISVEISTEGFK